MLYSRLGKTDIMVSKIGMGSEGYSGKSPEEFRQLVNTSLNCGINLFDMYNPEPATRSNFGDALSGRRKEAVIQGHICTTYKDGQYTRTRDIDECKASYDDLLERLKTDYIDICMAHYVDTMSDLRNVLDGPILRYMLKLKSEGIVKHLGISSHNPIVALEAVNTGLFEDLMFSVNPAFDMIAPTDDVYELFKESTFQNPLQNIDPVHAELYNTCEKNSVSITVMKAFGGGHLLDEKTSPLGAALSPIQCMHYALTRPGVVSVIGGFKSAEEILSAARYCEADESEKDFSGKLSNLTKHSFSGKCLYCGHCAPCSAGIDIAAVNKYLDLSVAQGLVPETVKDHYLLLDRHAGECLECRSCEENCPFGVEIIDKMKKAAELFGE